MSDDAVPQRSFLQRLSEFMIRPESKSELMHQYETEPSRKSSSKQNWLPWQKKRASGEIALLTDDRLGAVPEEFDILDRDGTKIVDESKLQAFLGGDSGTKVVSSQGEMNEEGEVSKHSHSSLRKLLGLAHSDDDLSKRKDSQTELIALRNSEGDAAARTIGARIPGVEGDSYNSLPDYHYPTSETGHQYAIPVELLALEPTKDRKKKVRILYVVLAFLFMFSTTVAFLQVVGLVPRSIPYNRIARAYRNFENSTAEIRFEIYGQVEVRYNQSVAQVSDYCLNAIAESSRSERRAFAALSSLADNYCYDFADRVWDSLEAMARANRSQVSTSALQRLDQYLMPQSLNLFEILFRFGNGRLYSGNSPCITEERLVELFDVNVRQRYVGWRTGNRRKPIWYLALQPRPTRRLCGPNYDWDMFRDFQMPQIQTGLLTFVPNDNEILCSGYQSSLRIALNVFRAGVTLLGGQDQGSQQLELAVQNNRIYEFETRRAYDMIRNLSIQTADTLDRMANDLDALSIQLNNSYEYAESLRRSFSVIRTLPALPQSRDDVIRLQNERSNTTAGLRAAARVLRESVPPKTEGYQQYSPPNALDADSNGGSTNILNVPPLPRFEESSLVDLAINTYRLFENFFIVTTIDLAVRVILFSKSLAFLFDGHRRNISSQTNRFQIQYFIAYLFSHSFYVTLFLGSIALTYILNDQRFQRSEVENELVIQCSNLVILANTLAIQQLQQSVTDLRHECDSQLTNRNVAVRTFNQIATVTLPAIVAEYESFYNATPIPDPRQNEYTAWFNRDGPLLPAPQDSRAFLIPMRLQRGFKDQVEDLVADAFNPLFSVPRTEFETLTIDGNASCANSTGVKQVTDTVEEYVNAILLSVSRGIFVSLVSSIGSYMLIRGAMQNLFWMELADGWSFRKGEQVPTKARVTKIIHKKKKIAGIWALLGLTIIGVSIGLFNLLLSLE